MPAARCTRDTIYYSTCLPQIGDGLASTTCPRGISDRHGPQSMCCPLAWVRPDSDRCRFTPHPDSLLNSCVNPSTAGCLSKSATNAISASVFDFGHSAYSAQPRNLAAASLNVIGSAGLPLPKFARPEITLPFFRVILMIEVILSKPAASASGSM